MAHGVKDPHIREILKNHLTSHQNKFITKDKIDEYLNISFMESFDNKYFYVFNSIDDFEEKKGQNFFMKRAPNKNEPNVDNKEYSNIGFYKKKLDR